MMMSFFLTLLGFLILFWNSFKKVVMKTWKHFGWMSFIFVIHSFFMLILSLFEVDVMSGGVNYYLFKFLIYFHCYLSFDMPF